MLKKQSKRKFITAGVLLAAAYAAMGIAAKRRAEPEEIDADNPYIRQEPEDAGTGGVARDAGQSGAKRADCPKNLYVRAVKPLAGRLLSFCGLVVLAPVYAVISAAVYLDNPGPVLFTQKRVGKDGHFFELHKFRTMKMNTPHDIPTHLLKDPDQYITRVGRILRKTSLDELPQIWDIFRGKMSVIGPRPALWNQKDLIAEREKYGANNVMPGLTGWAQINGRDELEIAEKAALDGEYVRRLREGNLKGMLFDLRCFFGTVKSVAGSDGVVEGGTGEIHRADNGLRPEESSRKNSRRPGGSSRKNGLRPGGLSRENRREKNAGTRPGNAGFSSDRGNGQTHREIPAVDPADAGFEDYGYKKTFCIDKNTEGKVLITGAGSYVGESFRNYAAEHYPDLTIDTVDMIDSSWREKSFQGYDCVFHVAGIAHADVGKVPEEEKRRYYAVNTDLAIETAEKAKADGVTQFILMSSMIVYGDSAPYGKEKVIDAHTVPAPANFYGDSKWQADKGVRKLQGDGFHVAVIRAPMIYGKGSKGNYPVLSKMAKKLPVFPKVENQRSMLYIENLCEFVSLLVMSGEGGIYFPQNGEYGCTSELVREIGAAAGKEVRLAGWLKPAVVVGSSMPGRIGRLADKAFGSCVYGQGMSEYEGLEYRRTGFRKSVRETEEGNLSEAEKKTEISPASVRTVLMLVNHDVVIYNFRLELVERLLDEGYEVHISSPYGGRIDDLTALGAKYHKIEIDRHGMNPVTDFFVLREYRKLIGEVRPIVVLGYTIKPNIYGAMAAGMTGVPFVANITGLGTAIENGGIKEKISIWLYKAGLKHAYKIFFQNSENLQFMISHGVVTDNYELLPGSGVNLEKYCFEKYPKDTDELIFTTIGRIMEDKGIKELISAAKIVKCKYPKVKFRLIGFFDEDCEAIVKSAVKDRTIEYIGQQRDVRPYIAESHAVIQPSYHEGMSNVLLEAAATGRPVLASDIAGCRETFEEGISGMGFQPKDALDLARTIKKFICLPYGKKIQMGRNGRWKMKQEFDRQIVVDAYMKEIRAVMEDRR